MLKATGIVLLLACAAGLGADPLRDAAEALERDDFSAAIPHLEAALEADPANTNARFNLAYARQATGDEGAAIEHYQEIAARQPDLLAARQNLAVLLMRAGRFAEAAGEYRVIADTRPEDPEARLLEAAASSRAGADAAAAKAYRKVVELDPSSLDGLQGLAGSLVRLGKLREALPHHLAAAELAPSSFGAVLDLASRLEAAGHASDAIEAYRSLAAMRPDDGAIHDELGLLLLQEGDYQAAARALESAIAIAPDARRHAALAEAYRLSGESAAELEQLGLAAAADPRDASARLLYANAILQQQEYERAAREYLAACEADPGAVDAWRGLGFAMYQLGNFPAALRALSEAERLAAPQPASLYLKAICQDNLQMYEEAQSAYQLFLGMMPEMPDEVWKAGQRLKTIAKILEKGR